jgi:uncharacterized protein YecT (DUF1311 family)
MGAVLLAMAMAVRPYDRFTLSSARFDAMLSPAYQSCERSPAAINTYGVRNCIWDEQRRFQARVATAVRAALGRLPAGAARARLRRLEEHWQATHRTACRRQFQGAEGTMSGISQDLCELRELVRRVAWLERYGR